jgi:phospholipase C
MSKTVTLPLKQGGGWYDVEVTSSRAGPIDYRWRMAGRIETGKPSFTDPAMHGPAVMSWADPKPT